MGQNLTKKEIYEIIENMTNKNIEKIFHNHKFLKEKDLLNFDDNLNEIIKDEKDEIEKSYFENFLNFKELDKDKDGKVTKEDFLRIFEERKKMNEEIRFAICKNDIDKIKEIIKKGYNINQKSVIIIFYNYFKKKQVKKKFFFIKKLGGK